MPALERGVCPTCGAEVALRKGGLVREHRAPNVARACTGSGQACATVDDKPATSLLDDNNRLRRALANCELAAASSRSSRELHETIYAIACAELGAPPWPLASEGSKP